MAKNNYTHIHKAELTGTLELTSPLHIGSGNSEHSDMDIFLDIEDKPYIPGTSLAGVIRHFLERHTPNKDEIDSLFGKQRDNDEDGEQSRILFFDASVKNDKVKIRDGIRIAPETGITEDKAKFDYQIVEPGAQFDLKIIVRYSDEDLEKDVTKRYLKTIEYLLSNEQVQIGANVNNGFGKLKLIDPKYKIYEITNDINSVWSKIFKDAKKEVLSVQPISIQKNEFSIQLTASLMGSLIIGDTDPNSESDKTHIQSNGKNVITGSTLKGVIRSRINRIINTKVEKNENNFILKHEILGFVKEEFKEKDKNIPREIENILKDDFGDFDARQGRLRVIEKEIANVHPEQQTRIKIDRFTGGTIESALFDSMPVFDNNGGSKVELYMVLDKKDFEKWQEAAGVLLLVLKDLWTGMLPIGGEKNVGRGRLKGVNAVIKWDEDTKIVTLSDDNGKPKPDSVDNWNILKEFVDKFKQYGSAK